MTTYVVFDYEDPGRYLSYTEEGSLQSLEDTNIPKILCQELTEDSVEEVAEQISVTVQFTGISTLPANVVYSLADTQYGKLYLMQVQFPADMPQYIRFNLEKRLKDFLYTKEPGASIRVASLRDVVMRDDTRDQEQVRRARNRDRNKRKYIAFLFQMIKYLEGLCGKYQDDPDIHHCARLVHQIVSDDLHDERA